MSLADGTRLGAYEIRSLLGSAGTADIVVVQNFTTELKARVPVK